jgi:hypothetical protein
MTGGAESERHMNMTVGVPASGGNVRLEDDVLGGKVRDNGVAVGAASLGEKTQEQLAGFPVPRRPLRICSRHAIKSRPGLPGAERIPDHMGRRYGRRHVEAPDFEDDKVRETSTIQDRCVLLKQIRSSPAGLRAARPARQPEAAGCRRVACTCDGDAGVLAVLAPGSAGTGHDGPCRRPASMRTVFPFPRRGRTFPALRGTREFGSVKRATVMHVHHG